MNEKQAKKLRRSLMTHDEWLKEKANRTYIFTEFKDKPRIGNRVLFRKMDNQIEMGVISGRDGNEYKIKVGTDEFKVGLEAIKPMQAACAYDKITLYKERKREQKRN